jgi:hypothetical protein
MPDLTDGEQASTVGLRLLSWVADGRTLFRMFRRAQMSRDLADLIQRSILASVDHAESYPMPSGPSGAFKRDLDVIADAPADVREVRDRLHATLISTVGVFLAHALDHIRALANDMLRDPIPIWSPLTLCRAVQESTVWMCHLLDPSIGTDTRLCRLAATWLDDSQPARTAASTFGAEHAAGVVEYHGFKMAELKAGGFVVDLNDKQEPVRVRIGDAVARLKLIMTDEVTRLMPEGSPSPYRLSSGAAHGRPWMLERSVTRTDDGRLVGEGSTSVMAALTVMLCMRAWVTAWGGYFGLDVTDQLAELRAAMEAFAREAMAMC